MPTTDAPPVAIGKAITQYIQQKRDELLQPFELERSYADWELELKGEVATRIDVALVTTKQQAELATRGGKVKFLVPFDVCVRRRFGTDEQDYGDGRIVIEEIDRLVRLTYDVFALFFRHRLNHELAAVYSDDPVLMACPVKMHLKDNRQFTSVVRLQFQAHEEP